MVYLLEAIRNYIPDLDQEEGDCVSCNLWNVLEYLLTKDRLPRKVVRIPRVGGSETHFIPNLIRQAGILVTVDFQDYIPGEPIVHFLLEVLNTYSGWIVNGRERMAQVNPKHFR